MPTQEKCFWKFKNSLPSNAEYVQKMEKQISETLQTPDQSKITDKRLRWEYLKYEIRNFKINVSKNLFKEEDKDRNLLEKTKNTCKKPN